MLVPGRCQSGYRLEELVSAGPLVQTWRATELRRGATRLLRVLTADPTTWEDPFVAAAEAQQGLIHPNRVQVLDIVDIDGMVAVVTEHVSGPTLATWLRIRTRTVDEILPVFLDIVGGVAGAHQVGVHHLALDSTAIWMHTRSGTFVPKVDLALGPMFTAGMPLGRVRAPEQQAGGTVDDRTDLFLLGALLYELATGRVPTGSQRSPCDVRPELAHDLGALTEWLLSPDPDARPESIHSLLAAFEAGSTPLDPERQVFTNELVPWAEPDRRRWPRPVVASMVAMALLSLAGALLSL